MQLSKFSIIFILTLLLFSSCKINYSFTGASIPEEAETVSVQYFQNNAPLVQPILSQTITDALKDKFTNQTDLILVERNGDLNFEGEIVNYAVQPIAIQSNETAALNRLTISVRVKYECKYAEAQNFETTFSRYLDYESSQSLSSVEESLITQITEDLVEDIFNKAVVNW